MKNPRKTSQILEDGPTPERLRRGGIERFEGAIADEAGRPARPYRSVDTLLAMFRRRTISAGMLQAAEDFRALFHAASLDPLRVSDLARIRGPSPAFEARLGARQEDSRRKIGTALQALGGIASPAGSCVWHVVGCEWNLKEWAAREGHRPGGRPLNPEAASGVLIGALGMLQAHFGRA
jgi:hypothetical protein